MRGSEKRNPGKARQDNGKWVFNRLDCIEYLKSDCGWTHKKAIQETHATNKGLFSRLRNNGIILKPESVGDAPKKGKEFQTSGLRLDYLQEGVSEPGIPWQ